MKQEETEATRKIVVYSITALLFLDAIVVFALAFKIWYYTKSFDFFLFGFISFSGALVYSENVNKAE